MADVHQFTQCSKIRLETGVEVETPAVHAIAAVAAVAIAVTTSIDWWVIVTIARIGQCPVGARCACNSAIAAGADANTGGAADSHAGRAIGAGARNIDLARGRKIRITIRL